MRRFFQHRPALLLLTTEPTAPPSNSGNNTSSNTSSARASSFVQPPAYWIPPQQQPMSMQLMQPVQAQPGSVPAPQGYFMQQYPPQSYFVGPGSVSQASSSSVDQQSNVSEISSAS